MLNCKDMTKLISDSLEHPVSFRRRMEMRLHIMMCRLCRTFRENSVLLRKVSRSLPGSDVPDAKSASDADTAPLNGLASSELSPAAKRRMLAALNQAHRK
jgi:hypothetical protein